VPQIKKDSAGVREPATYTVNQAWERIGRTNITRQALYLAVERGDFPSIRLGRRVLIPRQKFEEFLLGAQEKGSESYSTR
jgi:excisionase family DNA binding protein